MSVFDGEVTEQVKQEARLIGSFIRTEREDTLKEVRRQVKLARKAENRKLKRMFVKQSFNPVYLEGVEQGLNNLYAEMLKRWEKMER